MLAVLIERRALLTSLHAPSTEPDELGHLLHELRAANATTTPYQSASAQVDAWPR